jgi:hypothetical protein
MKGLLLTLLKRRLLNLFWPLMRKKRQSEFKSFIKEGTKELEKKRFSTRNFTLATD